MQYFLTAWDARAGPFLWILKPITRYFLLCSAALAEFSARGQDLLAPLVVVAQRDQELDQESLANLAGGGDLRNLLQFQPNAQAGGAPGSLFTVRGIGQEGTLAPGNRTNVGLTVLAGDFPRSTNSLWAFGAPSWDMQELSVSYGPSLFSKGPAAPGGELRLEPRAPEFYQEGKLLAEIGGQGTYRSGVTSNTVWIPDRLALRFNLLADGNDGGITNVYDEDDRFAAVDRLLLRSQARWRPAGDDSSVVDALMETTRTRGNPLDLAGMRPDFELFDRKVNLNTSEQVPADHLGLSLSLKTQLDPSWRLEAWSTLQRTNGYQLVDFDSTPFYNWWSRADVDEERANGGFRLHQDGELFSSLIGFYADQADYQVDLYGEGFSSDATGLPFRSLLDETVEMAALYFRGEIQCGGGIRSYGGVRLDTQQRTVRMDSDYPATGKASQQERVSSVEFLPELGIEWSGERIKAGLRISRAYRPAGVAYAFTLGETEPYDAERGWEIQCHGEMEWDATRLSARVFHARVDGQQLPIYVPGGVRFLDQWIINAGATSRSGTEVEWSWQGPGAFQTRVHGGWLSTEFKELDEYGLGRAGTAFPNAPEWNAGFIAAWKPATGWFGESALIWQDSTYAQFGSAETTHLEERLELSARIGYRWRSAECYLFGTNLLDRDFALVRRDYGGTGTRIQGSPSMPRVLGIGFSVHW
ncbi:MAG: TonB-dependent receptor [Akkermansiaceae bacterium]